MEYLLSALYTVIDAACVLFFWMLLRRGFLLDLNIILWLLFIHCHFT